MNCQSCGKPLNPEDKLCPSCGAEVSGKKKSIFRRKWIKYLAFLLVAVIVVGAVPLYYYLITPVAVVVTFRDNVSESQAIATLAAIDQQVAVRTEPKEYNLQFYAFLSNYSEYRSIQFWIRRYQEPYYYFKLADDYSNVEMLIFDSNPEVFYTLNNS